MPALTTGRGGVGGGRGGLFLVRVLIKKPAVSGAFCTSTELPLPGRDRCEAPSSRGSPRGAPEGVWGWRGRTERRFPPLGGRRGRGGGEGGSFPAPPLPVARAAGRQGEGVARPGGRAQEGAGAGAAHSPPAAGPGPRLSASCSHSAAASARRRAAGRAPPPLACFP